MRGSIPFAVLLASAFVAIPARADELPPPPPSPPGVTVNGAPTPKPLVDTAPRRAHVVFEPLGPAVLQTKDPISGEWDTVCEGPCDVEVAAGAKLQIDGPGMSTSRSFDLGAGDHHVRAVPGSLGRKAGGIVTLSVGGFFAAVGALVYAQAGDCPTCKDTPGDRRGLGGGFLVTGAVAAIVGMVLLETSRTEVDVDESTSAPAGRPTSTVSLGPAGIVF